MKHMLDFHCERCGNTTSMEAQYVPVGFVVPHVCVDGEEPTSALTVSSRLVLGPGERTKDAEEKAYY